MIKKLIALIVTLGILTGSVVWVQGEEKKEAAPSADVSDPVAALQLSSKSMVLFDAESGKVLLEQNADEQRPPASVTKIMTMSLVMERVAKGEITLQDMVTASENAKNMGGTQINLDTGEQMSVYDLMMSVAVASANDAAVALGEFVSGSEQAFVDLMNAKAQELGMKNTQFANSHGLHQEGHVTSARDIAIMTRYLLSIEGAREFVGTNLYPIREGEKEYLMRNTNDLIRTYEGCLGVKTGYTTEAGSCLSAAATRGNMTLIAVVMGEPDTKTRNKDVIGILDYGFATYDSFPVAIEPVSAAPIKVILGMEDTVNVVMPEMKVDAQVIKKGQKPVVEQKVELAEDLKAPVEMGQIVGQVRILMDGSELACYDLKAEKAVPRRTFGKAFGDLLKKIITL